MTADPRVDKATAELRAAVVIRLRYANFDRIARDVGCGTEALFQFALGGDLSSETKRALRAAMSRPR